jgi:hypothetical protein
VVPSRIAATLFSLYLSVTISGYIGYYIVMEEVKLTNMDIYTLHAELWYLSHYGGVTHV